jgi:lysophospholipase L1-like esterase
MSVVGRFGCAVAIAFVTLIRGATGDEPSSALKPIKIVIVGDSTAATYSKPPADRPDLTGWGQVFGEYFKPQVTIANHARSGASSKSFVKIGEWDKALAEHGDYMFIQFGHNDTPGKGDRETNPKIDFRDNLRRYIEQARAGGAKPVLLTPTSGREWADGKLVTHVADYVAAIHAVGKEQGVPVIDVNAVSRAMFTRLGDAATADFSPSAEDRVHFSRQGAHAMAKIVVDALPEAVPELKAYLNEAAK